MVLLRRQTCLLLLLGLVAAAQAAGTREGVFVGYKEAGVEGGDDGDAANAAAENGGGAAVEGDGTGGGLHAATDGMGAGDNGAAKQAGAEDAAVDDGGAAAAEAEAAGKVLGRTVVLHTQFGPIRVKMLEKLAPKTTALVWSLAEKRGCRSCAFYRNEAQPRSGAGPPYALLQGRLDVAEAPPSEGNIAVKMGHVCFIPKTKDFFIAYGDHPEWGTSHTVWGVVDEWFATDFIISQQYRETTHSEFGTKMRMLKQEVPVRLATEGDTFYSGLLGPMHYEEPPL